MTGQTLTGDILLSAFLADIHVGVEIQLEVQIFDHLTKLSKEAEGLQVVRPDYQLSLGTLTLHHLVGVTHDHGLGLPLVGGSQLRDNSLSNLLGNDKGRDMNGGGAVQRGDSLEVEVLLSVLDDDKKFGSSLLGDHGLLIKFADSSADDQERLDIVLVERLDHVLVTPVLVFGVEVGVSIDCKTVVCLPKVGKKVVEVLGVLIRVLDALNQILGAVHSQRGQDTG